MPDYGLLRSPSSLPFQTVEQAVSQRQSNGQKTLSFEFFPPKDQQSESSLWRTFEILQGVEPDFVSVTYGAGGSNREKSIAVVDRMASDVLTIGHLTCVGASKAGTIEVLKHFESVGVRSILALRGDPPKDDPEALSKGELRSALELVTLAASQSGLEIGVAAFPEGHPESTSMTQDASVLKLKQAAGAKYAITQLFFDVSHYQSLLKFGSAEQVDFPIIPGIMPISNAKQVLRMATLSGAAVPNQLVASLEEANELEARRIGMEFTIELGRKLLASGAPGLHIFSLNQPDAALEVARSVGLCA